MPAPIDYSRVADLYDSYVNTTFDIPFWVSAARGAQRVLELMAGTGRVSIPLLEQAKVNLTCVDRCGPLLDVLRKKLSERDLSAHVVEIDVRELALDGAFDLVIIPFHSFAKILTPADQVRTLARIKEHLAPQGRLILTLHNPPIRLKSVDGQLHLRGRYGLPGGGVLLLWHHEQHNPDSRLVEGFQLYEQYDSAGLLKSKRLLDTCFYLLEYPETIELLNAAGLRIAALYGDYAWAEFHESTSPYMIWELSR